MWIARVLDADLRRVNRRGFPLSPWDMVAVALLQLSGACFQHTTGNVSMF